MDSAPDEEKRTPRPKTALNVTNCEERQAVATLGAAKAVASEIEQLTNALKDEALAVISRREVKAELVSATERLCNLLALALFQLTASLNSELHDRINQGFDELRQRLAQTGVHLILDRLKKVHRRAEAVLKGDAYPIGLATRLRAIYIDLGNNLHTLKADNLLSEADQQLIQRTGALIDKLAAIEAEIGLVAEMGGRDGVPAEPSQSRR